MGLDQSIYRQKRDVYDEIANLKRELRSRDDEFYQSHSKEVDELSEKINALYQSGKSGDEVDWNEINKIREDFQAKYPDFFNKKIELEKRVGELSGDKEEMSYFTDWSFHQYLSKLYGVDIILNEIIDYVIEDVECYADENWNEDDVRLAIGRVLYNRLGY